MKILVWHGKYGEEYFDATDENKALKFLFNVIDKEYEYYDSEYMSPYCADLYEKAKAGNMAAIKRFLCERSGHEYEGWAFEDVQTDADFADRFGEEI